MDSLPIFSLSCYHPENGKRELLSGSNLIEKAFPLHLAGCPNSQDSVLIATKTAGCFQMKRRLRFGRLGTSLVGQWLRIRPPMRGTQVRALIPEDATCHGAIKPVRHNY